MAAIRVIYLGSLVYLWFFLSDFEDLKTVSDFFDNEEFKSDKRKSLKFQMEAIFQDGGHSRDIFGVFGVSMVLCIRF